MSIQVKCNKCKEELNEPGGLAFAPPGGVDLDLCYKFHFCRNCWILLMRWVAGNTHE